MEKKRTTTTALRVDFYFGLVFSCPIRYNWWSNSHRNFFCFVSKNIPLEIKRNSKQEISWFSVEKPFRFDSIVLALFFVIISSLWSSNHRKNEMRRLKTTVTTANERKEHTLRISIVLENSRPELELMIFVFVCCCCCFCFHFILSIPLFGLVCAVHVVQCATKYDQTNTE